MRNLLAIFLTLLCIISNAQVKIFPGGSVSFGTLTTPPGYYKGLFAGPLKINQSASDQTLLYLNATNQMPYSNSVVTFNMLPYVKNYVVEYKSKHPFWVYGNGEVYGKSFGSSSDSTLKANIVTIDSALTKVLGMRGVYFQYKDELTDT